MPKVAVIIPCYNESKRLSPGTFQKFLLANEEMDFVFVDDASTDDTSMHLNKIAALSPNRIKVYHLEKNKGKGGAVRVGILEAAQNSIYDYFGYLDADMATSLGEFYMLYTYMLKANADFIAGSRIKMMNTEIERSTFRHVAGRGIATIVDLKFKLGIYDTQCGAKCFRRNVIDIFEQPFCTRWFFDVELFLRLRKYFPAALVIEKPLNRWKNPADSSLSVFSFPTITKEIISLFSNYSK